MESDNIVVKIIFFIGFLFIILMVGIHYNQIYIMVSVGEDTNRFLSCHDNRGMMLLIM
jgi:biopolymer transport protein ExbB/TolQ